MHDAPHICFTFVGDVTRDSRLRRFRQAAADIADVSLVTLLVSATAETQNSESQEVESQEAESPPAESPDAASPASHSPPADSVSSADDTVQHSLSPVSRHFHLERFGRELRFRPFAPATLRALLPPFWREGARAAAMLDADLYFAADLYALPAAAWAARRTGRPLIYDARELYRSVAALTHRPLMQRFWRLLERRYARGAQAVLTVNESIAEILRGDFSPVHVIRNLPDWSQSAAKGDSGAGGDSEAGVASNAGGESDAGAESDAAGDSAATANLLRRELDIPENRTVLLSQGGVQRGRGALVCIDALAELPECDLVFLGDGPMRDDVRLHAEVCGRADRVHLLPAVPSEELPLWTASADIGFCIIENLGESYYLSLPNKLFEYIAAGVPVVGSDFPEIGAVLRDSGAGVTVDPSSAVSVARGVRRILDEPGMRERLREGCRSAARDYSWDSERESFMDVLREVLSVQG